MKKTGTIKALNMSPKGFHEGLLLDTGKTVVQINLPKDDAKIPRDKIAVGAKLTFEVEAEEPWGEPAHEVFRLVRVVGDRSATGVHRFSGKVVALNYALHGEVNGGILDSGEFLHLKPEGAAALGLAEGMKVKGSGELKQAMGGQAVIEASEVNGVPIARKKAKKHA
jgi:hypothetical protein